MWTSAGLARMIQNIKISAKDSLGYHELNQHKPWLDKECSKFLDQRKKLNCNR
jgi:hypothetical protein